MSFHMDKEEYDEWVAEGAFDRIWAAYEYAVRGGEPSVVDNLRGQIERLRVQNKRDALKLLKSLTKEQRLGILSEFCWHCGVHDPEHECDCEEGGTHEV